MCYCTGVVWKLQTSKSKKPRSTNIYLKSITTLVIGWSFKSHGRQTSFCNVSLTWPCLFHFWHYVNILASSVSKMEMFGNLPTVMFMWRFTVTYFRYILWKERSRNTVILRHKLANYSQRSWEDDKETWRQFYKLHMSYNVWRIYYFVDSCRNVVNVVMTIFTPNSAQVQNFKYINQTFSPFLPPWMISCIRTWLLVSWRVRTFSRT
jgi:hypothetical protein